MNIFDALYFFQGGQIGGCRVGKLVSVIIFFQGGQIGGCRVGKLVVVIIFFQGGQIGGCRVGKLVGVEWANWWVSSGQIGGCQSGQKKNLPTKKWAKEEFAHQKVGKRRICPPQMNFRTPRWANCWASK